MCIRDSAYVNQHVALVRLENTNMAKFVAYYLQSPLGQKQLFERERGITRAGLGLDDIRDVQIPIPSINQQEEIIANIESRLSLISEIENSVKHAREQLDYLDRSILSKAFQGALVPQDPNDEPASKLLERIRLEKKEVKKKPKNTPVAKFPDPKAYPSEIRKISKMNKSRFDEDVKGKPYLANIMKLNGYTSLPAQRVFAVSNLSVADFYKQLSEEIVNGFIFDRKDKLEISDAA